MTEWATLGDASSELLVGLVTAAIVALGVAASGFVVTVMTAAFQLWMSYSASKKVEAVRVKLEETTKATAEASEMNIVKLKKIEDITNHNYQKMQEESAESRKALEKANEEIAKGNKEVGEMAKALALMVQAKHPAGTAPAAPAPVAAPGLVVEGEIHDLVISNKPTEEKAP